MATESSSSSMKDAFSQYADYLNNQNDKRERIVKASRDITMNSKEVIFQVHRMSKHNREEVLHKRFCRMSKHNLLSESVQDPTDQKLITHWRSAVDSWVDRLLLLISSDMPDKCWAGICLLGVTCQECSFDRFLASYSVWYQKLVSPLQSPTTSQFVKVASCASMSDLLTRAITRMRTLR